MSSEQSKDDPASLWSTLPKAISLVVSLSALGYFIGWRESSAFYESAGAPWAAMSVPPAALLQQSSSTVLAIAFGAFFSLVLLIDNKVQARKLTWFCALLLLASSLCLLASQGSLGKLEPKHAYTFASIGSTLCAVAAGITLTELYEGTRSGQTKMSSGYLWLVYWFALPGLFWAPDRLGQARSLRDMDVSASTLPSVSLDQPPVPGDWRLVHLYQDQALIVKLDSKRQDREFKVLGSKDIRLISSVPAPGRP
ncbi:MAG: hypothetical protein U1F56_12120 [Rubrivivax sp.]